MIRLGLKIRQKAAYVPEENELAKWFSDRPEWLTNTSDILLSCDAALPPSESLMPVFPVPDGETSTTLLEKNGMKGLQKRLGKVDEAYEERLRYEISCNW